MSGRPAAPLTLEGLLEEGPFTLNAALDAACQIARALELAHARGAVPAHVHAANVLALTTREFALVDLEPAKGHGYLAPEELACEEITPATNQYQLGLLLHHMITGELPNAGLSLDQVRVCRVSGPPISVKKAAEGVPFPVDEIGRTLLAASPDARFPSMRAARMALEAALEAYRKNLVRRAEPESPARRSSDRARHAPRPRPARRDALVTVAMAILVAASVLVLGVHLS